MTETAGKTIAIVGGGASGVIFAANLVKANRNARATLIERAPSVGRGLAYSTELPEHRLNVAANRMSAFGDDPLHLWNWYMAEHPGIADDPGQFLTRPDYARYLTHVFAEAADAAKTGGGWIRHLHAECVSIVPAGSGLELRLSNGTSLAAQTAVLATGHDSEPRPERPFATAGSRVPQMDPDARIAILGSGLSMIDAWLTLEARGHRGEIVAVSRRGLLPLPHHEHRNPIKLDSADIPFGTELSYFVRWFSDLVDERERAGGNWRDVIDGIRPFNQQIWRDWPISAKRRFLEHAKAWWDVHRHRIAPDIHERAQAAIAAGRLRLLAGKVSAFEQHDDGLVTLTVRRRHALGQVTLENVRVLDCTGIVKDPATSSNPLIASLIELGLARPDTLRIGLDVTPDCQLIDSRDEPSDRIFAIGPLTRGTFFEIDAVPEIREQSRRLALRLSGGLAHVQAPASSP